MRNRSLGSAAVGRSANAASAGSRSTRGSGIFVRVVATVAGATALAAAACGLDAVGTRPDPVGEVDVADATNASLPPPGPGTDAAIPPTVDAAPDAEPDAGIDAGPYSRRVTTGLVALYEFEEDAGAIVHDTVAPPTDLTIKGPEKVSWKPHTLDVDDFTVIKSDATFDKAATRCKASKELTVEAWIEPDRTSQDDYGRIVTMSDGDTVRNFALGSFKDNKFWASIHGGEDLVPNVAVKNALAHLVSTRTSDGTLRLYVDSAEIGSLSGTKSFDDWTNSALVVANVAGGGRGWRGVLHLIAIYDRALGVAEIQQNYLSGADP